MSGYCSTPEGLLFTGRYSISKSAYTHCDGHVNYKPIVMRYLRKLFPEISAKKPVRPVSRSCSTDAGVHRAPTTALDFLLPYDEMRSLVTGFIDAARSDPFSSCYEVSDFLAYDLMDARGNRTDEVAARKLQTCKRFFEMERRRKREKSTDQPQ